MNNILSIEDYLIENSRTFDFTDQQIRESLSYLNMEDPELLEAWYNTVLDFAALIPGIGSVAEGINLVSYAKQGEYLLAGLCAIGLIPIFGQYIGVGGTFLVKALRGGANIGKGILTPLTGLIARFLPRIVEFLKSAKFLEKFKGIGPYVGNMIKSLKGFVMGGTKTAALLKNPAFVTGLKTDVKRVKTATKVGKALFGGGGNTGENNPEPIPIPSQAYGQYSGKMKNIRPYEDTEIRNAEMSQDWAQYI
jgi:hypothetical protein